MGKKVEVSYNPQLGYLQTIFHHNFDFLTGIKSYTERTDGVEFVVDTYKENTVKVFIQCVGETAFRFRMYTPGNEHPFDTFAQIYISARDHNFPESGSIFKHGSPPG